MYFNTRVLDKGTIFTSSLFYDLIQATQTFISLQGKGSTFIIIFKTLSIGSAPRIEPTTSRSAVKRSSDWAKKNPPITFQVNNIYLELPGKIWVELLASYWILECSTQTKPQWQLLIPRGKLGSSQNELKTNSVT